MKKSWIGCIVLLTLLFPFNAYSGTPLNVVKERVGEVLAVLRNPSLKGEAAKENKQEKIRSVSEKMFDFIELSKRTLGQNWAKLSPDQQKEFVSLYQSLLEEAYTDKITSYTDEKVQFEKEVPLSGNTVEVQTTIVTKTTRIPINYRLIEKGGDWKVYDVVIEGVSLIGNYRTQFREILSNKPPEALLDALRKKTGKS